MNVSKYLSIFALALLLGLTVGSTALAAVGAPDTINYQGRLKDSDGVSLTGTYDFVFKLYDASSDGNLLATETENDISVTNGYFSVLLDFDGDIADFANLVYVDIQVKEDSALAYETMATRASLNSTPYSFFAKAIENSLIIRGDIALVKRKQAPPI